MSQSRCTSAEAMDDWDSIEGLDGWTLKLRALLQEDATRVAQLPDPTARLAMSERLTQFVEYSFPNTGPIKALDEIAARAAIGLLEQNIDDRLRSLVSRNLELVTLTKQLDVGPEDAQASAASIRLARSTRTLNDGVAMMRELRSSLESASDRPLVAAIDKAVVTAQAVRALLERTQAP